MSDQKFEQNTLLPKRTGFEKFGAPVNKFVNKLGSEAFWPTTLDHESDKASRILKSFCKEGFYKEQPAGVVGPKNKPTTILTIPPQVIQNAVGLAIFSVGRVGAWAASLSGGSGVLIARKEDGTWSPPAGILVNTVGLGWIQGIDVYDCVVVINNREALAEFTKTRFSLGGEASLTVGPVGTGGYLDANEFRKKKQAATFTYIKSRGLYLGIQLDGTVMWARNDENSTFYGHHVTTQQILRGEVATVPVEAQMLLNVIMAAEGFVEQHYLNSQHQQQEYSPPQGYYDEKRQYEESVREVNERDPLLDEKKVAFSDEKKDVPPEKTERRVEGSEEWETLPSPVLPPRPDSMVKN